MLFPALLDLLCLFFSFSLSTLNFLSFYYLQLRKLFTLIFQCCKLLRLWRLHFKIFNSDWTFHLFYSYLKKFVNLWRKQLSNMLVSSTSLVLFHFFAFRNFLNFIREVSKNSWLKNGRNSRPIENLLTPVKKPWFLPPSEN